MFGTDRRVIVLAFARMADSLANSFLIIVLPLYIASGDILLPGFEGTVLFSFRLESVGIAFGGIPVTVELLVGVALSLFGFLNSFAQPFTGRASDRTGRRKAFILFGLAILAVSSVAYSFVDSYEALLVVRGIQGLGGAFVVPTTVALVNDLARSNTERGGNFGVFNTFRLIGFGFGPTAAGFVIVTGPYSLPSGSSLSGFDAAFGIAVVGALTSFMLVWFLIDDPELTRVEASDNLSIAVFHRENEQLFDPVFVLGLATLLMAITIALFATLQEPINARLDQGSTLFGLQFAAVVIANIIFQVPVGRASDRIGRKPFLVGGLLLLIPAVFAQGVVTSSFLMLIARLAHGVSVAMVFAPALAAAGDLAGEGQSGTTLSVLTMGFSFGVAIGPLASGVLYGFGFVVPFAFGSVLAVVAVVLVVTQVEETLPGASTARSVGGFDA